MKDTKDSTIVVIPKEFGLDSFFAYIAPKGKIFAGRYRFPGGKLKPNENYTSTLERELLEEYGIELKNIKLHHEKPNVLGGKIFLCSAQKKGIPIPNEIGVGEVEWMNSKKLFESNMVPNCKIALYAYLLDKNPEKINELYQSIIWDSEFLWIVKSESKELYKKLLE